MAPDRHTRVSDLYHQALERPAAERTAFLKEACAEDDALRQEVESLLGYESASVQFLEQPAAVAAVAHSAGGAQMLNRQLGSYTIVAPLGAGGMGEVYRARDSKLERDVAIKILPSHFTADPERRARFAREARLLATLNHPHIGAIYGLEESDGVTALVLELVEGPTLAEHLARGPLPTADALAIARQIAEALDAAHEKGIVHRDLKPANIVLQTSANASGVRSGEIRAKVLDFGLAKTMAVGLDGDLTQRPSGSLDGTADGRILGTPAYMSPEQARGHAVDKRTDIWAFGCVLYEMLAGRRAFDGETMSDTFVSILEREPDWAVFPVGTPASIRRLLERCLRKDTQRRLHDIADALIEIHDGARPLVSSSNAAASPSPVVAPRRRREWLGWALAVSLALVLCAMVFLYVQATPPAVGRLEFDIALPENWLQRRFSTPTFEISPDGLQLAIAASSKGESMLWVRSIRNPPWRRLAGTEGANAPFWSPDSQSLGFFADEKLKTVRVSGGLPATLCNAAGATMGQVFSGAWNADDVILFAEGANSLMRVGATGGHPTPATTRGEGEIAHRWPSFLHDGQHFLFFAVGSRTSEWRVGSLGSPDTTSLGPADSNARYASDHLLFVRGERLMAHRFDTDARELTGVPLVVAEQTLPASSWQPGRFSVSLNGILVYSRVSRTPAQLTWMSRDGAKIGTAGEPGIYVSLDLSSDDQQLAVSKLQEDPGAESNIDIWRIDLGSGRTAQLTRHAAREHDPAWSPDMTRIAFTSSRIGEKASLWVRPADPGGEDTLLVPSQSGRTIAAPAWSPNKPFLMYTEQGESTKGDLLILPLSGEPTPQVFLRTRSDERNGVFSPDSDWVAYESDASGRREIYVRRFPPAVDERPIPISLDGGRAPRWRGDGREIFFLALDGHLMSAGIERANGMRGAVPQQRFQTNIVSSSSAINHPYVAAADGKRFLIPARPTPPGSEPITVVFDWPAILRK